MFEYAVFAVDEDHHTDPIGLCGDDPEMYDWAANVRQFIICPSAMIMRCNVVIFDRVIV
jgi:hypothetical protein